MQNNVQKNKAFAVTFLMEHPSLLGRQLGYNDLRDDLHGEWMKKMLATGGDMTLQAHRGSYKTTCLCIVLAILLVIEPWHTIIFLRKTDNDVAEVIRQVLYILKHETFQRLARAIHGPGFCIAHENASEITLSCYCVPRGAVQLLGIGIGGSITGKHADIIITDDIVNTKDRASRAERERTKTAYSELQNVKNRGGRIINTGTPWHKEDAFSIMPPPERYDCYQTNLISKEQLEDLRQRMPPSLFAANYELRHIAAENALFSTPPKFVQSPAYLRDGIAHIDAAYGGEDYTALTCGKRIGDNLYMYGRLWRAHVSTVQNAAMADARRLMCAPVYLESNADKGFLGKELSAQNAALVHGYHEKQNKYIKIASYLKKWWANIYWLEGTDPEYLSQIMDYTEEAEHDDAPDSAACVCRILDRRQ